MLRLISLRETQAWDALRKNISSRRAIADTTMARTAMNALRVPISIHPASTERDMEDARKLFREYAAGLGVSLDYQGFEQELAGLPGLYAPPRGRLRLARSDSEAAGCVAFRPLTEDICEMKRLYVRPGFRGGGLGKKLVELIIAQARGAGYCLMRLDTLPSLVPAMQVYESLGFKRCAAYYETPLAETVFMELNL
jgi:putative acetyltransferase